MSCLVPRQRVERCVTGVGVQYLGPPGGASWSRQRELHSRYARTGRGSWLLNDDGVVASCGWSESDLNRSRAVCETTLRACGRPMCCGASISRWCPRKELNLRLSEVSGMLGHRAAWAGWWSRRESNSRPVVANDVSYRLTTAPELQPRASAARECEDVATKAFFRALPLSYRSVGSGSGRIRTDAPVVMSDVTLICASQRVVRCC